MKSFTKITKSSVFLLGLIFLILTSCNNSDKPKDAVPPPAKENPNANAKIDLKTYKNDTTGWGYDIIVNDNPYIHQPHKPGVPGVKGFNTEEEAKIAGNFVISKIRKSAGMPMVTKQELDSLGVLK
jgi:hypothetical protein